MKTITVKGNTKISKVITAYRVKIIMTKEQSDFAGQEVETVDEMKSMYYHALLEHGIDVNKFEENEFEYLSQNNYDLGTMLIYTCNSFSEIQDLLTVKLPSIYSTTLEVKWVNQTPYEDLISAAIADARKRAELIAKNIGKKMGAIVSVNDENNLHPYWSYYSPYDEFFTVDVVFEIS
ncbi:SIMPL domain-containing protein [Flavobacteriaceae bacterium F08102]|nr:SIMPL domain-containing protein [Flavobacteriaceae bacterium F08102]